MDLLCAIVIVLIIVYSLYKYQKQNKTHFKASKFGDINPKAEKYCVIVDVETTGLPKDSSLRATKANIKNFPRIVEIAWGVFSMHGEIISTGHDLIKQKSKIPKKAISIHGITNEMCSRDGEEAPKVLKEFYEDTRGCKRLVAHNVMFDKRIIETEFIRCGMDKPFKGMSTYCTMKLGRMHLGIQRYPKLTELYESLCSNQSKLSEGAHRAVNDVSMTTHCFFILKHSGSISRLTNNKHP